VRASSRVLSTLALLTGLTACGASTINDAADPQARKCKAALEIRLDGADAAAAGAPSETAAQAAIANSMAGPKPKECEHISDALGARLLNELATEATGRAAAARQSFLDGLGKAVGGTAGPTAGPSDQPVAGGTPTSRS
jgi:hypothetical protein